MSDVNGTQNTTPADSKPTADTRSQADKVWDNFKAFFGPVASLVTARTLWTAAIVAALGFWLGWTDIRVFGLSALWAVIGVAVAYVARKFLMPEVKASEYYDLAKGGNTAAAIVVLAVAVTQAACILVVALGALRAGV